MAPSNFSSFSLLLVNFRKTRRAIVRIKIVELLNEECCNCIGCSKEAVPKTKVELATTLPTTSPKISL